MPKRPSLDPHEERLLVALVLEGEPEALGHFLSYFAPRLEDLWRRGAGRRFAREDLALDYVHWFLTDWLARPDGTWKNLRRFERQQARGFVDWWRARATWLWRDFHREHVVGRHARARTERVDDLDTLPARSLAPAEARLVTADTARELAASLDALAREAHDVLPREARARFAETEGPARVIALLDALGFELDVGAELVPRRGRVSRPLLSAAERVGRRLRARGYDRDDVRRALPLVLAHLRGS